MNGHLMDGSSIPVDDKTQSITRRNFLKLAGAAGLAMAMTSAAGFVEPAYAATVPSVSYRAHVKNIGWMATVKNGATAGTIGQARRMEALKVFLTNGGASMVRCCAHVTNNGWLPWVTSGKIAGTVGQKKKLQAVKMELTGSYARKYDILYRAHVSEVGWLAWAKNGSPVGSKGCNLAMEAVQVKLCPKGTLVSGKAFLEKPVVNYCTHCRNIGWSGWVLEGMNSGKGTIEAIKVALPGFFGENAVSVSAHVKNKGWLNWVSGGAVAGTTGQNRQMEAVRIKLTGKIASVFDIYYRVYVQNYGWTGYAKNGAIAGTVGANRAIEGITIVLRTKGSGFNTGGPANPTLSRPQSTADFVAPLTGYRTTQGWMASSKHHLGIDIVSSNTAVRATMAGEVVARKYNSGNGNCIVIKHSLNGRVFYSFYAHLKSGSMCVNIGQKVSAGQKIGVMGSTGNSTGPHLHFGIANKFMNASYYGYTRGGSTSGNSYTHKGVTYYNPAYVLKNNRLP